MPNRFLILLFFTSFSIFSISQSNNYDISDTCNIYFPTLEKKKGKTNTYYFKSTRYFKAVSYCELKKYEIKIYSANGKEVFYSNNINNVWNAENNKKTRYIFFIEGTYFDDETFVITGNILKS